MIKLSIKKKGILGILLAAAMIAGTFGAHQLKAAEKVELDRPITIGALVDSQDYSVFATEFKGTVNIKLYKIAQMTETGELTPYGAYSNISLDVLKNNPTAESVKSSIVAPALEIAKDKPADATIVFDRSQGQTGECVPIETENAAGLYLYVPEETSDNRYIYKFTPYVIFAPTSEYISPSEDVIDMGEGGQSDRWNYESNFKLKSSETPRYGSLEITKTINKFSTTNGPATFVYNIKAVRKGSRNEYPYENQDLVEVEETEEVVFDDIRHIEFTSQDTTTTKSITIENIPADAEVTVSESYPGGAYEPDSDMVVTTFKVKPLETAEPAEPENEETTSKTIADRTIVASFKNKYNDKEIIGGISAVNHFEEIDGETYWISPSGEPVLQTERAR